MISCNVGDERGYSWEFFDRLFSGCITFPQVLVVDRPDSGKILFEIKEDTSILSIKNRQYGFIPVLPGSAIDGDGKLLPGFNYALAVYVRVPNIEELDFYERYSKL